MIKRSEIINDFILGFSNLESYIRISGKLNLNNINVHAENFIKDILNELRAWNLVNTNTLSSNAPCIDLIDENIKTGIQVTAEKGSTKINHTISCLTVSNLPDKIEKLKVFSTLPKQRSYTIREKCPGIEFNSKNDILDFSDLTKEIRGLSDDSHLQRIHSILTNSLPHLFLRRSDKLEKTCQLIREGLTTFNRRFMNAPFNQEHPVDMCKAIIEMRISLQKSGLQDLPNDEAARKFLAIQYILTFCEERVKEEFPYIHVAALKYYKGKNPGVVKYLDGDFNDSIHLMMSIRPEIETKLKQIRQELNRLEALI